MASGARHHEKGRKCGGGVIEFSAIVTLDTTNGASKLHEHISEEVRKIEKCVRLMVQWKGSWVVRAIIKNDRIILVAWDTKYRGGRKIIVDKIKGLDNLWRGTRKR
jgi:hypothetical protein